MRRTTLALALELAFLLLVTLKFVAGLAGYCDLSLWDESSYLRSGANFLQEGLRSPYWGPLYSLWFFALSHVVPDRIDLYYRSWQVLIVADTLAIWLLLLRLEVRRPPRIAGVLLVVFGGFFFVTPHIACFAVLVLALACLAAHALWPRSPVLGVAMLQLGFLVDAFVRPEYFAASLLYLPILAWVAVRHRAPWRHVAGSLAVLAVAYAGLMLAFGVPLGGDRLLFAFGQHYSVNMSHLGRVRGDPWLDYEQVLHRDFGNARTMPEIVRANPAAFARHVLINARSIPLEIARLMPVYESVNSFRSQAYTLAFEAALYLLVAALMVAHAVRAGPALGARLGDFWRRRRVQLAAIVPGMLPSVAGLLLIYPRQHYLVPLLLPLLVAAILLWNDALAPEGFASWLETPRGLAALLVVGLIAFPNICGAPWPRRLSAADAPHPVAGIVRHLLAQRLERRFARIGVLELDQGYGVYLPDRFVEVEADKRPPGLSFGALLAAHEVKVVVATPHLKADPRYAHDPGFQRFRSDPAAYGFIRQQLPAGTDVFVAR